ncbi:MAG: 2-oxoacid:acceptor oxidoreductase subunit alpha [Thermoplasmatota archaeon]
MALPTTARRTAPSSPPHSAAQNEVTWRIGGQQGEGIDSTSDIFAKALARKGVHVHVYRNFSSRIRGGLTWSDVRISEARRGTRADSVNLVVALGQDVVDASLEILSDPGIIVYDSDSFKPELATKPTKDIRFVGVPMTKIAEEKGSKIMKNMVALGASARLLGVDKTVFYEFVEERFAKKGEKVISMNKAVIDAAYLAAESELGGVEAPWTIQTRPLPSTGRRLMINGNDAAAYGALVAGCRFVAGYPITPATDLLEWFIDHVDEYGGVVVQAEDELSAINMCLGAGYAGTRAMTSTSGPGLSLMTEAMGLAGSAEIPVVIVDVMRPGPSTGLPTKHAQADLQFVINAGHDDFPRIVLSPSTVEEAFELIQEGFNYAEEYQVPVFFLLDQELGISYQTVDTLNPKKIPVRRGKILNPAEIAAGPADSYKRYAFTPDGISPRAIPGMKNGLFLSTGSEHSELSVVTENVVNRTKMMEKRFAKLATFRREILAKNGRGVPATQTWGPENARVGIITWGSTRHSVEEALTRFEKDPVARDRNAFKRLVITHLWPFPVEQVRKFIASVDVAIVVEVNYTGQLERLIRQEVGGHEKLRNIRKWDGTPFRPVEIEDRIVEILKEVA